MPLLKTFSSEKIELQHKILEHERVRTDRYFSGPKRVVEIDEKGHTDRNQNEENKRQTKINILTANFFTGLILMQRFLIFFFFFQISKIQGYIAQSNKEKIEKEKEAEIKELKEKLEKIEAQIKEPKNKN